MCKFELVLVHASQGQAIIIIFFARQKEAREAETKTAFGLGLYGTQLLTAPGEASQARNWSKRALNES